MENKISLPQKQRNQSGEAQVLEMSVELRAVEKRQSLLSDLKITHIAFRFTSNSWGWLPAIAFVESLGLLLIAQAYVGARAASASAELLFWIGLALLIMPVAIRLASAEVSRRERMALIILLGMIFYLVKFMHSPFGFTFPDEFSNIRNVREILQSHRLFMDNPELPVMSFYPGLPTITSTLVSLSGLSIFQAGMLVIGAARLILFLALFLLYEQVSGSARVGSIATLLYMANPNFLFYTAEYSYESLALPLAILVLYAVVRREMRGEHRIGLTVIALLGLMTVVITHHMTSYALTAFLCLMTVIVLVRSRGKRRGPWDLAVVALLATSFWLTFIASYTVNYLSPVFGRAVRSVFRLTIGEESSRQLFRSSSTEYISPLWEQFTAFGAVILISIGMPFGWLEIWRRHHKKVFFLFLGVIALAYLPMQLLRFTSAGWETANRSSEFLFIGVAFVLALSVERYWLSGRSGWSTPLGFVAFVVILIFGGFIAGWPPQARLPRPYIVATGSHMIEPQSITVAKWTREYLGPNNRFATGKVGAKLLNAYGGQDPFTGGAYGIKDMLFSSQVGSSERDIIQGAGIRYILSDRLLVSWDHMIGLYFFNHEKSPARELIGSPTFEKFDGLENVNRILDSGDIVIYDVGVYLETTIESRGSAKQSFPPAAGVPAASKRLTDWSQPGIGDEGGTPFGWEEGILTAVPTLKANQGNSANVLSSCNEPIPARWVLYTVKPGDTLFELTQDRGSTPAEIRRINCLEGKILLIDLVIWLPPIPRPDMP